MRTERIGRWRRGAAVVAAIVAGWAAPAQHAQAWTYKVIHTFCSNGCYDGQSPGGGLILDSAGNLYGATTGGGTGSGVVFKFVWNAGKARWDERVLYNFCGASCKEGGNPGSGRLVSDTAGNLYGVTANGGRRGAGSVFRLTPSANGKIWSLARLYDFCTKDTNCPDGSQPFGGLTYAGAESGASYDGVSPLFGTTETGGKFHDGAVFSLSPAHSGKWKLKALYSFCKDDRCKNGAFALGGLIADGSGNLYLSAEYGGKFRYKKQLPGGTVLKLSATDSRANQDAAPLYRFCTLKKCIDGAGPLGLVSDATGALFGSTLEGGANNKKKHQCYGGCGVLYQLAPDGSESVLYSFCSQDTCTDGSFPEYALTLDASGNLFGMRARGGNSDHGTVFEFSGGSLQTLYKFCSQTGCADGVIPSGPLVMDSSGNLFGETSAGSARDAGVVFELSP